MAMVANLIKVKVDPKDLKSIPDILPYRALLQGEAVELELTKKEICRCMNFGDVYDLTSGEEVLINEVSFKELVEYVDGEVEEVQEETPVAPVNVTPTPTYTAPAKEVVKEEEPEEPTV